MATPLQLLRDRLKGRTYKEVGDEIGVSAAFICNVLKGKRKPGPKVLKALGLKKVVSFEPR